MTEQPQPLNLRAKLAAVYEKVDHIEKTGHNVKQNYDFVKAADVLHAIRKALVEFRVYAENNFDLLSTYDIKTNSGGNMHTATVKAFIVFHDLDSDEKITASGLGDGADGGDKGIYKAQTGAIKNALRNAFLVPDAADPEADQSVDEAVSESAPKKAPSPVQPAQPPKAEIPQDNFVRTEKTVVSYKQVEPVQTLAEAGVPAGSPKPSDEQYDAYVSRLAKLRSKLESEGGLKASRGLPAPRKMLNYIKQVTQTDDLKQISITQFDAFLQYAEKMDPVALVTLINDSKGGK
jgi:ERF superfamily